MYCSFTGTLMDVQCSCRPCAAVRTRQLWWFWTPQRRSPRTSRAGWTAPHLCRCSTPQGPAWTTPPYRCCVVTTPVVLPGRGGNTSNRWDWVTPVQVGRSQAVCHVRGCLDGENVHKLWYNCDIKKLCRFLSSGFCTKTIEFLHFLFVIKFLSCYPGSTLISLDMSLFTCR